MNISKACEELLKKGSCYHHLYRENLSNHLPMVLIALDRMGADGSQLQHFYDHYVKRLDVVPAKNAVAPLSEINHHLGDSSRFHDFRVYFEKAIAQNGYQPVLKKTLPTLIAGIAASGFHSMIRLAYSLEAENTNDLTTCLAYWASEYHTFEFNTALSHESIDEIFRRFAQLMLGHEMASGTIVFEMDQINRIVNHQTQALQPESLSLAAIARFCISRYARTRDFIVLHTVTGCHAFRLLLLYVDDEERAMRCLWQAVLIANLSAVQKEKSYQSNEDNQASNWDNIIPSVLDSENDHTIKLIYSCWKEWQVYKNPIYLDVAMKVAEIKT